MQEPVTLNEIIIAVRELTFDRFVIPAFAIKGMPTRTLTVEPPKVISGVQDLGRLTIKHWEYTDVETVEDRIVLEFSVYQTLETLMNALIDSDIVIAYTPYFKGTEPSSSLVKVTDKPLDEDTTTFRRYFFSDDEIETMIIWYYYKVLTIPNAVLDTTTMAKLMRPSEKHIAIWVSYYLVDKRRLYENASLSIEQSFSDGTGYLGSSMTTAPANTSIQIGSVFSITENATEGYFQEDFNRVGSDNIWGDRYSFWYKLMLYLRQLLEETFNDYSLRKDNIIQGKLELTRDLDFRSYFDSYPFTLSPLSRGIISHTP